MPPIRSKPHTITTEQIRAMDSRWLQRQQVADWYGVDVRTVTRAIDNGEIPAVRLGRRVLIPREALLRQLDADNPPPAAA